MSSPSTNDGVGAVNSKSSPPKEKVPSLSRDFERSTPKYLSTDIEQTTSAEPVKSSPPDSTKTDGLEETKFF
ncbi:hypothetical protein RRG08_062133, partial [Elysia crispata]